MLTLLSIVCFRLISTQALTEEPRHLLVEADNLLTQFESLVDELTPNAIMRLNTTTNNAHLIAASVHRLLDRVLNQTISNLIGEVADLEHRAQEAQVDYAACTEDTVENLMMLYALRADTNAVCIDQRMLDSLTIVDEAYANLGKVRAQVEFFAGKLEQCKERDEVDPVCLLIFISQVEAQIYLLPGIVEVEMEEIETLEGDMESNFLSCSDSSINIARTLGRSFVNDAQRCIGALIKQNSSYL